MKTYPTLGLIRKKMIKAKIDKSKLVRIDLFFNGYAPVFDDTVTEEQKKSFYKSAYKQEM
jgi:hypothetical protein